MKNFFTLLSGLLLTATLSAQNASCVPDPSLPDTLIGVFPLPYEPTTNPDGGIKDTACLNRPFEFIFTAVVGENFNFNGLMFPLDSVRLPVTGGVSNLPAGLTYGCNPGNCVFKKKTQGCVAITGTVTDPGELGSHSLAITAQVFINGSSIPLGITFPSSFFPGEYVLAVREENFTNCSVASTTEPLNRLVSIKNVPNPFSQFTDIQINTAIGGEFEFQVFDLVGRPIESRTVQLQEGHNSIRFDAGTRPDGYYLYHLRHELGAVSGKMCISGRH